MKNTFNLFKLWIAKLQSCSVCNALCGIEKKKCTKKNKKCLLKSIPVGTKLAVLCLNLSHVSDLLINRLFVWRVWMNYIGSQSCVNMYY